jgi:hypothetical protein
VNDQRHRDTYSHVRNEQRHLTVGLQRLINQWRRPAEGRIRQGVANADAVCARTCAGNSSDFTSALIEVYPVRIT